MKCRSDDPSILTLPLVLGYCGLLLLLSTAKPQFDANLPVDQIGHFIVFAGLGVSVARYFSREFCSSAALGLLLTLLSCAFLGLCDEVYQSLIPGRDTGLYDFLTDCGGALAGGALFLVLQRAVSRRVDKTFSRATG
jgi:VanZ family protein